MIDLIQDPIDYHALTERVRTPRAGAVLLFLGTAREITGGRQTAALDYEAYVPMARQKLAQLIDEASSRWPVLRAAIVHRLGRLEPGEVSVAIALSTPHRAEAFQAGQYMIDRLKVIVPIWKKEHWADGTCEWVHPGWADPPPPQPGVNSPQAPGGPGAAVQPDATARHAAQRDPAQQQALPQAAP